MLPCSGVLRVTSRSLPASAAFPSAFCIAGLGPALWLGPLSGSQSPREAKFRACLLILLSRAQLGVADDGAAQDSALLVHVGLAAGSSQAGVCVGTFVVSCDVHLKPSQAAATQGLLSMLVSVLFTQLQPPARTVPKESLLECAAQQPRADGWTKESSPAAGQEVAQQLHCHEPACFAPWFVDCQVSDGPFSSW